MIKMTGLNFVERNDDGLEKDDMFFSERHCETTDDAGQDIQKFRSSVELHVFVNEGME